MRRWLTILLLAGPAWAAPAWAGCPVAADMAQGVRVAFADGTREVARREPGSVRVTVDGRSPAGGGLRTTTVHGLFPLLFETYDPVIEDARDAFAYDVPPERLPLPGPGLRITLDRESGGIYATRRRDVYETGALTDTTVGGCPVRAFGVAQATATTAAYEGAEPGVTRSSAGWLYLVDLGFAVPLWTGGEGGAARRAEPAVVALEAVR